MLEQFDSVNQDDGNVKSIAFQQCGITFDVDLFKHKLAFATGCSNGFLRFLTQVTARPSVNSNDGLPHSPILIYRTEYRKLNLEESQTRSMSETKLEHAMKVHAFVTAGGQSSRMGRDKAWLELAGRPMIELVVDQLSHITPEVAIIANGPEYSRLGYRVFSDEKEGIGPLEAIRTALRHSSSPLVVLVACDLPFVRSELFLELINRVAGYDAVVPIGPDGRLEPLCAVYATRVREPVTDLVAAGERKMRRLFEGIKTRFVSFDELRSLEGSDYFFVNVNTPEDYIRAQQLLGNREL